MTQHTVKAGEGLMSIARHYYNGNGDLYLKIAEYNGIPSPYIIKAGQTIQIPDIGDSGTTRPIASRVERVIPQTNGYPPVPYGLNNLIQIFGNINAYANEAAWERAMITRIELPFSIGATRTIRCHKKMTAVFTDVFAAIEQQGLAYLLRTCDGCFVHKKTYSGTGKWSTHAWGIAIDLNASTNAYGRRGDMSPAIVAIFQQHGFKWGGDWSGKSCDPMHFQYCTGY